jgi:hypothetical protein
MRFPEKGFDRLRGSYADPEPGRVFRSTEDGASGAPNYKGMPRARVSRTMLEVMHGRASRARKRTLICPDRQAESAAKFLEDL